VKQPVVLIGVGEMGGVFARGLLRLGHPVYPVIRSSHMAELARQLPAPQMVLVSVGEADLQAVLDSIPLAWNDRLALLQNELLPADFEALDRPTVISAWFEKKPGQEARVIIPSPVHGPNAELLRDALATLDIPARVLREEEQLLFELVVKNLYILTSNIAGLRTGGTVSELWQQHQPLASRVAEDVITLQEGLTGQPFDHQKLIAAMVAAFEGDPAHQCMGRSAPARLTRAIEHADRLGLAVPALREIAAGLQ